MHDRMCSLLFAASFPGAPRLDSLPKSNPDVQSSILKEITDSALYDRFHFEVKDLQVGPLPKLDKTTFGMHWSSLRLTYVSMSNGNQ